MTIYKPCDIRGDAAGELTPALYQGWGRTLGLRLPPMAKFVVGGDVRARRRRSWRPSSGGCVGPASTWSIWGFCLRR